MALMIKPDIKFYDTSSLLLAGENLFEKKEKFLISSVTLQELEQIKTSYKDLDTKYSARIITRLIEQYPELCEVIIHRENYVQELLKYHEIEINNDTKILSDAYWTDSHQPYTSRVIFVTNDLCLKNIANLYFSSTDIESIEEDTDDYSGYKEIYTNDETLAQFYQNPNHNHYNLKIGQYLILRDESGEVVDVRVWTGTEHRYLKYGNFDSMWFGKIKPYEKDIYQKLLFDSLTNNKITLIKGPPGSGKAQPISTIIPTLEGTKRLGDILPGDYVLDRKGNPTKVLGIFPQGKIDNYKITLSDGRVTYCNDEHIWSCYTSKGNLKDFTVRDMLKKGLKTNSYKTEYRFKIPINQCINYPTKNLSIDPYVMGCLIGDGCLSEQAITISSADEELIAECYRLIPNAIGYHKQCANNYSWNFYCEPYIKNGYKIKRVQTSDLLSQYPELIKSNSTSKVIPKDYLYSSKQQRLSLLQGLLDTDGTIDKEKGRIRFTSINYKLVLQVQQLVRSLGFNATISIDNRKEKYTTGVCYNLSISCPNQEKQNLFRLKRKKDIAIAISSKKGFNLNKLAIVNIEKMPDKEEMVCILVDNEEHLYLTNDFIVTHNTLISLGYLMSQLEANELDKIIVFCNTVATANSAKLGYLPGTRNEKLLDSQIGNLLISKFGGRDAVERLIAEEKLILLPMSDIRGYDTTGMRAGVYISEAQNLDRTLIKLALQRVGEDCICIIDGDAKTQVDDIHFAGNNNGMRRVSKVYRGYDIYGEVELKNIYRSRIAKIADGI